MRGKPVSQWSETERLAWGKEENAARLLDLSVEPHSDESLKAAQDAAKRRRNTVGASSGQAFEMVVMAQREERLAKAWGGV